MLRYLTINFLAILMHNKKSFATETKSKKHERKLMQVTVELRWKVHVS